MQIFLNIYLVSLTEKNKREKIKARIAEKKEKRMIENKILNVKKLADSDSEEDAVSWVNKTKTIQEEMEKAKKKLYFCFVKRPENWKKWIMYLV